MLNISQPKNLIVLNMYLMLEKGNMTGAVKNVTNFSSTFNLKFFIIIFVHMSILPACIFVCHTHPHCLQRPEEDIGFPKTWTVRIIDSCELLCGTGNQSWGF